MAFIVSAAATAAVAAASGGAITTGVAGALSAAVAGGAGAGTAAGAAAAGIGAGALTGGAVGAGLGAGVSALQGKDPGQGALMGAATGAIGGAVLPGVGGAINGVGGTAGQGINAAAPTAGQVAAPTAGQGINSVGTNVGSGVVAPTADTTFTGANITSDFTPPAVSNPGLGTNSVLVNPPTPLQNGIAQGSQAANPGAFTNPVADQLAASAPGSTPMMGENMTQEASAALAKQEATNAGIMGQHGTDTGQLIQGTKSIGTPEPTNISGYVGKGINWIKDNPVPTIIGGASLLPMLGGSEPNNGTEYTPDNTNYLSSNFQRTAPQGVVPVSGYASGGILSGMPGADLAKDFVGQISPSLGNNLFGKGPMNPIVARSMQQAQQAQGPQQQIQAQGPQQAMQGPAPAPVQQAANGGIMQATDSNLGGYAHGGIPRLLRGPGDGVSDDIPATIAGKQPARLADGEFVIPARIVSELGNGSTEAGGRVLQAMVDRIQARRSKTVGKGKVAVDSKAKKGLPV
jgi:hypothetical protein